MTIIEQWLTGIGLDYAMDQFAAAGITSPDALAELEASHFESLGVHRQEDRRKLFFLVQRVKTAQKNHIRDNKNRHNQDPHKLKNNSSSSKGSHGSTRNSTRSIKQTIDAVVSSSPLRNNNNDNNKMMMNDHRRRIANYSRQNETTDGDEDIQDILTDDNFLEDSECDTVEQDGPTINDSAEEYPEDEEEYIPEENDTDNDSQDPDSEWEDDDESGNSNDDDPDDELNDVKNNTNANINTNVSASRYTQPLPSQKGTKASTKSSIKAPTRSKTNTVKSKLSSPMRRLTIDHKRTSHVASPKRYAHPPGTMPRTTKPPRSAATTAATTTNHHQQHPNLQHQQQQQHQQQHTYQSTKVSQAKATAFASSRRSSSGWSTDNSTERRRTIHTTTTSNNNKSFQQQIQSLRKDNNAQFTTETSLYHDDEDVEEMRIRVVVRKRPMSRNEIAAAGDVDVIHPIDHGSYGQILFYQPKTKVDLTKQVETLPFSFDNVFDEHSTNLQIYERCVRHLIPCLFDGQWVSIFAYGQTASGKTYTMMGANMTTPTCTSKNDTSNLGLYYMAALDIFQALQTPGFDHYCLGISLFEIYGGKLFDLLNERKQIKCLEDSKGKVQFPGLTEHGVESADELMKMMERGACHRSTGTTSRNADSSRSHAVLQLHLRENDENSSEFSRLTFIDLAGSERGADTTSSDRRTRLEGAEINTSLLALKEVIRALATGDTMVHVPFRGSKLTQVLKESFVGRNCRSVMVACISPNIGNCEQTLNTLRYADRVKERNSETGELTLAIGETARGTTLLDATTREKPPYRRHMRHPPSDGSFESGTLDLLDELLASPPTKDPRRQPSKNKVSSPPQQHQQSLAPTEISDIRRAAQNVIAKHKEAMSELLEIVKEEMDLVNMADSDREGLGDYTAKLAAIHERQLDLFESIRESIQDYRVVQGAASSNLLAVSDSFDEDLRD